MSHSSPDATANGVESDIAATRERLAESVDALADKVNVKAQAERKVEETKAQAQQLVGQAKRASLPVQVAIVALPVTVIVLLIVKAVRGRRS